MRGTGPSVRANCLLVALAFCGSTEAQDLTVGGDARLYLRSTTGTSGGPLLSARQFDGDGSLLERGGGFSDGMLRLASSHAVFSVSGTVDRASHKGGRSSVRTGRVLEGYLTGDVGELKVFAGKRVVSWDVGYGFRPNDVVQSEDRHALIAPRLEGQVMVAVDWYGERSSATVLTARQRDTGALPSMDLYPEGIVAGRGYWNVDGNDLYLFLKAGRLSRISTGIAAVTVPSESTSLYGSVRYLERRRATMFASGLATGVGELASSNPVMVASAGSAWQSMIGATWTSPERLSLIAEVWWDGLAPGATFWRDWQARNAQLLALGGLGGQAGPVAAYAGNLRWQATALEQRSLWRRNLLLRAAKKFGDLEVSAEALAWLNGGGGMLTVGASQDLDRASLEVRWRQYLGPQSGLAGQLGGAGKLEAGVKVAF